jgi:hypothetical protein
MITIIIIIIITITIHSRYQDVETWLRVEDETSALEALSVIEKETTGAVVGVRGERRGRGERRARALEPFLSKRRDECFSRRRFLGTHVWWTSHRLLSHTRVAHAVLLFFPLTDNTSPRERATTAVAALVSFLANAYTIHIARSSNDAPTRRGPVVLDGGCSVAIASRS